MKSIFIQTAIIGILVMAAHAQDNTNKWSTTDKALFATYTAFNVADILQTRYAFDSDDYDELNPILSPLGKNGATAAMVASNIAMYFIVDGLQSKNRAIVLSVVTMLKIGVVGHNAMIGVGFKF